MDDSPPLSAPLSPAPLPASPSPSVEPPPSPSAGSPAAALGGPRGEETQEEPSLAPPLPAAAQTEL